MKYIIEIKPEYEGTTKGIIVLGIKNNCLCVDELAIEELEELNAEYINNHFPEITKKVEEADDEIKVGDEVVNIQSGARFCVTHFWVNNHGEKGVSGFNHECSAFQDTFDKVKKTGRHFEIDKILEEMKE